MAPQKTHTEDVRPAAITRQGQAAEVVLNVPDITCGHCAQVITRALEAAHGVRRVAVDISRRLVHVRYDAEAISLEALTARLAKEGYPATSVEETVATMRSSEEAEAVSARRGCACCA